MFVQRKREREKEREPHSDGVADGGDGENAFEHRSGAVVLSAVVDIRRLQQCPLRRYRQAMRWCSTAHIQNTQRARERERESKRVSDREEAHSEEEQVADFLGNGPHVDTRRERSQELHAQPADLITCEQIQRQ
jgi:hypothetical protein